MEEGHQRVPLALLALMPRQTGMQDVRSGLRLEVR